MSDDLQQRIYPEDERLHAIADDPDRRMTRAEWEREESLARQAAHKRHEQVQHDRDVQQEYDKHRRRRHRSWKPILLWGLAAVVVLLLIFFVGYLPKHRRDERLAAEAKQRELEHPKVEVFRVTRTGVPGPLTIPGTTAPLTEAYIYARANGYLRKRFVDIGDHVHKGQVLGIIDAPELDQQVDQAREQVRQAEAQEAQQQAQLDLNRVTWERWRTLVAKGVFSRQDGDQRETDYRAQVAIVASAHRNVESYRANLRRVIALQEFEYIRSPFDGIITQRNSDVGALVGTNGAAMNASNPTPMQPAGGTASVASGNTNGVSGMSNTTATPNTGTAQGGPIFAVAQIDVLRILVSVPEGYSTSMHPGQSATLWVQNKPEARLHGTVARIAQSLDQNTRTMLTEVDVDNRSRSLYPGMYTVVTFDQVRGAAPLAIPGDAVIVRNDRTSVAVVDGSNHVHIVPVQIGRDYGPSVEIQSGLKQGDVVVLSVVDGVRQGALVQPELQQSSETAATGTSDEPQTRKAPDAGPDQYGDQSIVNANLEGTNNKGSQGGQHNGTADQGQNVKQSGPQQKAGSGKGNSQ